MKILQPGERILHEKADYLVTMRAIEVYGLAPGGSVTVCEIGAKVAEKIPLGTEMVVDDIEHNRESLLVTGIHKPLQGTRSAIAVLHREREHTVITPIPRSGELGQRHEFDGCDAQRF